MEKELQEIFFFMKVSKFKKISCTSWLELDDNYTDTFRIRAFYENMDYDQTIIPDGILNSIEKICDELAESEYIRELISENAIKNDYIRGNLMFDLIPENELKINVSFEQYYYSEESADGIYEEIDEETDSDLIQLFKENEITRFSCDYNGGGDSGYAENFEIESNKNITWNNFPEDEILEDLVYRFLSDYYSGWEINEGSYGSFVIESKENYKYLALDVTHTWNVEYNTETIGDFTIPMDILLHL